LQDALMARLDRLGRAKEIAQLGATLGREFTYEVLHAVSPLPKDVLQGGLKQLVEAELVYHSGMSPNATYVFKHALIQDTAYQSLLKSKRQQLHQQIAQILATNFPIRSKRNPNCWPITTLKPDSPSGQSPTGSRQESVPPSARHI